MMRYRGCFFGWVTIGVICAGNTMWETLFLASHMCVDMNNPSGYSYKQTETELQQCGGDREKHTSQR